MLHLKPEIRQRWTDALRSGQYLRGRSRLRKPHGVNQYTESVGPDWTGPDEYCCLGVLCELAVEDGVLQAERVSNGVMVYQSVSPTGKVDSEVSILPTRVLEWSGLTRTNPGIKGDMYRRVMHEQGVTEIKFSYETILCLSSINDYTDLTFSQIADLIDADALTEQNQGENA